LDRPVRTMALTNWATVTILVTDDYPKTFYVDE
jgi:hypothetical protein